MKEKVVITKLSISQVEQIILFQVKMPRDAIRITGINVTVTVGIPVAAVISSGGGGSIEGGGSIGNGSVGSIGGGSIGGGISNVISDIPTNPVAPNNVLLPESFQAALGSNADLPISSPQWIGFRPNTFLGDVRLQSYGKANIFMAEDVYLQDSNIGQGYFSSIAQLAPNDWSHGVKRKKSEVLENGNVAVLKGIYRDRQPATGTLLTYTVGVYIWYEINPKTV
jgi:hypothetical protein